jgi:hypothetical protein
MQCAGSRLWKVKLINAAVSAYWLKANDRVSIASKLRIDNTGIFATSLFYLIVGIILFVLLPSANYPPHIGVMAILSVITAYGIFRKRNWSLWTVVMLFFIFTTFGILQLYWFFGIDLLFTMGSIALLALTWVFTVYTATKRLILTD